MSIELIDSHCHLNLADSFPDPEPFIYEAFSTGVKTLIFIGLDPETSQRAIDLAERFDGVYAVVGRHPNYSADYKRYELAIYAEMLGHSKVVALGEIGLDYHWDYATREQQEACLYDQLDLARDLGVPVVIHCRDACPDLLTILEKRDQPTGGLLFHCFSGDANDANRAIQLGCCFGFDGPLTYKKSSDLRALVKTLPRESILIETDSPFMTPEPFRGKPNKPAYLPLINKGLATTLEIGEEESAALTTANARRFFRLGTRDVPPA